MLGFCVIISCILVYLKMAWIVNGVVTFSYHINFNDGCGKLPEYWSEYHLCKNCIAPCPGLLATAAI